MHFVTTIGDITNNALQVSLDLVTFLLYNCL